MIKSKADILYFVSLAALCVATRLLDHPPNFVALGAAAFFAGWVIKNRTLAFLAPVTGMLLADLALGFYHLPVMLAVYSSVLLPVGLGVLLSRKWSWRKFGALSVTGAAYHFVVVNFAVWQASDWYANNWIGCLECYAAGLPFLKYKLAGDLMWTGVLFGLYAVATQVAIQPVVRTVGERLSALVQPRRWAVARAVKHSAVRRER